MIPLQVNNLHEVAKHMGVSYDTLQNKFRTIKKDATKLQEDVKDGKVVVPATPARTKSVPSTPKSNSKTAAKDPLHSKYSIAGMRTRVRADRT